MPQMTHRQITASSSCLLAFMLASCAAPSPAGLGAPITTEATAAAPTGATGAPEPTIAAPLADDALMADAETTWERVAAADQAGDRVRAVDLLQGLRARIEGADARHQPPESLQSRMAMLDAITIEMRKRAASLPAETDLAPDKSGEPGISGAS